MKIKNIIIALFFSILAISCEDTTVDISKKLNNDLIITETVTIGSPFVGIGPQWGGYDNVWKWTGNNTLSDADWQKLLKRVDFLRPGLVRIMAGQGWNYYDNDVYDPEKSANLLFKMLDYCQANNINVMYGEWGENPINGEPDSDWLGRSVDFLDYLINTKNYTCIKYLNMLNEPAGEWSTIGGSYNLWEKHYEILFNLLETKGLTNKVKVIAPDIAVWGDTSLSNWMIDAVAKFGDKINAYDIHTYPSDDQLKGGNYNNVITYFRNLAPTGKEMIVGELGLKYDSNSTLGQENARRIENTPNTADDSNMMVYDAFYGVDMADAIIQNMDAGYNGIVVWDMDDAMYDDGNDNLKRWGFWNILGEEAFGGAEEEEIRPWFYTMSLLCRYFPVGSTIHKATLPNKKGLRAIAAQKDGKYTIAIANSHTVTYDINLKMDNGKVLTNAGIYSFVAGEGAAFEGKVDANGFAAPLTKESVDFSNNQAYPVTIKGKSFLLITNME